MSGSPPARGPGRDPSVEELVAAIRHSLDKDLIQGGAMSGPEDVFQLDPSMMVPEPQATTAGTDGLVAPEAAAAAAQAVGSLVRTLTAERAMQVRSGGPTVEDIVREEIRALLKVWLDTNLPPIVERLVRAEIERVVGRASP